MRKSQLWDAAAISDRGRLRRNNEDSVLCDPLRHFFAIADGMGGHASGEIASRLAIDNAYQHLRQAPLTLDAPTRLRAAFECANAAVLQRSRSCDLFAGMGTTLLIATLTEPHGSKPDTHDAIMHYAHVGDSRLYRVRRGELSLLTRDHTVAQWWVDNGLCSANEARASSGAHRLTRAIGMDDDLAVEIGHCISTPGDLFLLCSDGLTHELDDEQIAAYCRRAWQAGDSADSLCRQLVELANEAGGRDNISVLVVHHCDTAKYT